MTKKLAPVGKGRYAFLLFDATFKAVICNPENELLLISSITFINKEKHGLVISEKVVNFDLLCKDDISGEEFLYGSPAHGIRFLFMPG